MDAASGTPPPSRFCRICSHENRTQIDDALSRNDPPEGIAKRFNTSVVSILMHRSHLPGLPDISPNGGEIDGSDVLAARIKALQEKCLMLLEIAEGASEPRSAFVVIRQAREQLEALGRLTEQLQADSKVAG